MNSVSIGEGEWSMNSINTRALLLDVQFFDNTTYNNVLLKEGSLVVIYVRCE